MPRKLQPNERLVPGYQLTKFLGRGGFGQVWAANGPGGVKVALKIIDMEGGEGLKEFRGIRLFKNIHHPNLAPIIGVWLRDEGGNLIEEDPLSMDGNESINLRSLRASEMILAMGLGDKNLLDLLRDFQAKGQQGIPITELLDYMEGAARAIDFLNTPRHDLGAGPVAIQHGDIKPQNILIVGDATQVCDFGLARALGSGRATRATAASFTTAYAAPELLMDNKPGRFTDQYALAISYVELRTGELPFNTTFPAAILYAHTQGKLDLSKLSGPEQPIIRRATALKPDDRYPLCLDMIRELRRVLQGGGPAAPQAASMAPQTRYGGMPGEGKEMVPGYILVRPLGKGSFGEVWETKAPGGKHVALKIIRNLEAPSGKQEFKALEMIKGVDHNNLMELHAYWLIDAQGAIISDAQREGPNPPKAVTLVIACKLAKKHLGQRLRECLEETGRGIPLPELLSYMDQSAAAIDFLNTPQHHLGDKVVAIQHRDIKPENILLADGTVKVADFGLAKVLEDTAAIVHAESAGLTLAYAAPELFRGRVTQWTDQYALAITYYQLRTGVLPFQVTGTANDIVRIHLDGKLDFSRVQAAEAQVLRKAASVVPEERFPSCAEFCGALINACADSPEFAAVGGVSGVLRFGGSSQRLRQSSSPSSGRIDMPSGRVQPGGPGTVPALGIDEPTVPGLSHPAARGAQPPELRTTPNDANEPTVRGDHHSRPTPRPATPVSRRPQGPPPEEVRITLAPTFGTPSSIRRPNWRGDDEPVHKGGGSSTAKVLFIVVLLGVAAVGTAAVVYYGPNWVPTATQSTGPTAADLIAEHVEGRRWSEAVAALPQLADDDRPRWTERIQQGWLKEANDAFVARKYAEVNSICDDLLGAFADYAPAALLKADVARKIEEEKEEERRRLAALKPPAVLDRVRHFGAETDWDQVLADCAAAREHPKFPEIKERLALIELEALTEKHKGELPVSVREDLQQRLADLPPSAASDPYGLYAMSLVQAAVVNWKQALDPLLRVPESAWKDDSQPLNSPHRQQRAAQIVDQALTALFPTPRPLDQPFASPVDANQAAAALHLHALLAPQPQQPLSRRVLHVLADRYRAEPDLAAVRSGAERLIDDPTLHTGATWTERAALYLALARSQEDNPAGQAKAASALRSAWDQLPANDMEPLERYRLVLAPALELAKKVKPGDLSPQGRRDFGWLEAKLGRLIDDNLYGVDWPFPEPRQAAVDAFSAALTFDPDNAQWLANRARARFYLNEKKTPQERRAVLTAIEADAERAKTLKPDLPGGHHWLGYVRITQARTTLDVDERNRLSEQAVNHFNQARMLYEQSGADKDDRAQCYVSLSATYLDLANYWQDADPAAREARQRELLGQAHAWADKAVKEDAIYPDKAWLALAHATEDFGLLLGDQAAYGRAAQAFSKVIELRSDDPEGYVGQGRALYRAQLALPPDQADYRRAVERLNDGRRYGRGTFAEAEAIFWLGSVDWRQHRWKEARDAFENSLTLARQFQRPAWQLRSLECLIQMTLEQLEATPVADLSDPLAADVFKKCREWQAEANKLAASRAGPLAVDILVAEARHLDRAGVTLAAQDKGEASRTAFRRLETLAGDLIARGETISGTFWKARAQRHLGSFDDALRTIQAVLPRSNDPELNEPYALLLAERLGIYIRKAMATTVEQVLADHSDWPKQLDTTRRAVALAKARGKLTPDDAILCHTMLGISYWGLWRRAPEAERAAFIDAGLDELRAALEKETVDTPMIQERLAALLYDKAMLKTFDGATRAADRKQLCNEALDLVAKLKAVPTLRHRARDFDQLAERIKRRRDE